MTTLRFGRRAGLAIAGGTFCLVLAASVDRPREALSLDIPGGRLRIERVGTGSWWAAALAQSGGTATLENVRIELAASTIVIPRLDLEGASLSGSAFSALLDPKAGETWAARLARLSAHAIKAAELTVEQRAGSLRQTATYRDVLAENVVNGRFDRVTASGAEFQMSGPEDKAQSGRVGRLLVEGLDLAEAARIASEQATDDAPLKTIQGLFSADAIAVQGSDGSRVEIAHLDLRDIRAKPAAGTWSAALGAVVASNWAPGPERPRAFSAAANIADAFAVGSVEVTGVAIDSSGHKPDALRIARMSYTGAAADRLAEARMEGIDLAGRDTRTGVASLGVAGVSFASTIQGLRALADKASGPLDRADLRRLPPRAKSVSLSGAVLDASDRKSAAPGSRRLKLAVREMEFAADGAPEGPPAEARLGITGLTLPVPADSPPEGLKALADMGYQALDVSFTGATHWDQATGELSLREFSLSGQGMGGMSLTGVLGRVGKEAFDADPAVSLVALLGATAKTFRVTVANEGLVERMVADQAAKRGKSPDELRRDLGSMAAVGIPPMLGNSPGAKAIGAALARFIARPGKLTVSARAKEAGGLGIADISALGDVSAVLDKLDVTATAE